MHEPITPFEAQKKYLDEHYRQYVAFTRLMLSLATGSFSLLATFSDNFFSGSRHAALSEAIFSSLIMSMLAGIFVQHRIVLRPLRDVSVLRLMLEENEGDSEQRPFIQRRLPFLAERIFFNVQMVAFLVAFILLAIYLLDPK